MIKVKKKGKNLVVYKLLHKPNIFYSLVILLFVFINERCYLSLNHTIDCTKIILLMDIDTINPSKYIPESFSVTFQELSLLFIKIPNNNFSDQLSQFQEKYCTNKFRFILHRRSL